MAEREEIYLQIVLDGFYRIFRFCININGLIVYGDVDMNQWHRSCDEKKEKWNGSKIGKILLFMEIEFVGNSSDLLFFTVWYNVFE